MFVLYLCMLTRKVGVMDDLKFAVDHTVRCKDKDTFLSALEDSRFMFDLSNIESTRNLTMSPNAEFLYRGDPTQMTRLGFEHYCKKLSIPNVFANKIPTDLLIRNVNRLSEAFESPMKIVRRRSDGAVINIVGEGYNKIDTRDVIGRIKDGMLFDADDKNSSAVVSTYGNRISFGLPMGNSLEPKVGDVIKIGKEITNSEAGFGDLAAKFQLYRLVCSNGAIMPMSWGVARRNLNPKLKYETLVEGFLRDFDSMAPDMNRLSRVLSAMDDTMLSDEDLVGFVTSITKVITNTSFGAFKDNTLDEPVVKTIALDYLNIGHDQFKDMRNAIASRKKFIRENPLEEKPTPSPVPDLSYYDFFNRVCAMPHHFRSDYNRVGRVEAIGGKVLNRFVEVAYEDATV
jgi:hypothetical protein